MECVCTEYAGNLGRLQVLYSETAYITGGRPDCIPCYLIGGVINSVSAPTACIHTENLIRNGVRQPNS